MTTPILTKGEPSMPLKKILPIALCFLFLSMIAWETTGSGADSYSITGAVTDQQKKPLSGVMITAYDPVQEKAITVFTREGGRFKVPGLSKQDYKLRARLAGFEDEFTKVPYKPTPSVAFQ